MLIYKRNKLFLLVILLIVTRITTFGQQVRNEDLIYDENIKTVLFYQYGNQLSDPVMMLNSNDRLMLEFDDMSEQSYNFRYTVIHCDRNWNTSDLDQIEYIDGDPEGYIDDFEFSLNAVPAYVHYKMVFPSGGMKLKYSGNYILKVYVDNDDDENVIFTRRFFVVEPQVTVQTEIPYYSNNLDYTRKKQQINLKIFTPDLFNYQADTRMNVFIRQNGRWDNMKRNLKPTTVLNNQLDYNYPEGIVFDGGNQFRNFDMKSFYYQSMYIQRIISDANGYTVILHTDFSKAKKQYEKVADIHGRKLIKARNDQETGIEGEYAWVDFTLKIPEFENADVYIIGQINDWLMNGNNRMEYDQRTQSYKKSMFLKQGYYDYMYSVVPKGKSVGDITLVEGDWWDTLNEYKVYVYYSNMMPEYDRLVGYHEFLSHYE
jgi:hypothetical protein